MEKYTKDVELRIRTDKKQVKKEADDVKKSFSEKFSEGFTDSIKSNFKGFGTKDGADLGKTFGNAVTKSLLAAGEVFVDFIKKSWQELGDMVSYSTLSNERTRELAFGRGLTGSQAYGYQKAMDIMGFQSEEDLMFASGSQKEKFQELMNKYNEKYTELYDSGFFEKYMEFQYEMEDMKQELMVEVVGFFMENKDTIKTVMNALLRFAKVGIEGFGWIIDNFSGGANAASSSDIIRNYNSSNSTTIKIDNTFNGVNTSDQSKLLNAGQMTYLPLIQSLV